MFSTLSFVIEHIIPLSQERETVQENLAYACGGYNGHKYNKIQAFYPVDGKTGVYNKLHKMGKFNFELF